MAQNIKFPNINVPIISANSPIENSDQKVLFVGEAKVTQNFDVFHENVPTSKTEIEALFGKGSVVSQMLIAARKINTVVQFDVLLPMQNGDGGFASAELEINGGATAGSDGQIEISLGSKTNGSFVIQFLSGDTANSIALAISDYINLSSNKIGEEMNFNASASAEVVTINAGNTGPIYNDVSLKAKMTGTTLTATVTPFSGGNGEPNTSATLDLIGEERYQTIVWPYLSTAKSDLVPLLDSRFNAGNDILDGVGVLFGTGDFATILNDAESYNSNSIVYIAELMETLSNESSTGIFELPWVISAQFAAIRSIRREKGANISQLVISRNGALDAIGGPALSSKPYANTPMSLLPTVDIGRGFISEEIAQLNDAGATVFGNNKSKSNIIMGQVLTTYKNDSAGDPDGTFKFLNYVDTASTAREYFFNNLAKRYAQSRLTDGGLIKGRDMTNQENIRAEMTGFYQTLADVDYVVARSGESVLQFFKENMNVSVDLLTGTSNIEFSLPIVTQLREINAPMKLTFSVE